MNIVELGQISSMKYGKMLSKDLAVDEGFPVYSGYRITGYSKEYLYNDPMLIVVARGVGGTGDVKISPPNAWITNLSIVLELDDSKVDKQYLCYLLNRENLKDKLNSGAAQAQITIDSLAKYRIRLPPIKQQKKTAEFIAKYDDLIENNRRRIQLLEESARLLYQEWFVHLRFPGHEKVKMIDGVPDGWEESTLGSLASVQSGYAFKSKDWLDAGNPVIKIKNITGDGTVDIADCQCVDDNVAEKAQKFKLEEGDFLIAMTGATVGKVGIMPRSNQPYYLNQRVGKFEFVGETSREFVFCLANTKHFRNQIENLAGGAAQPNISGKQIESIKVLRPSDKLLSFFSEQTHNLFEQRQLLVESNKKLAQARDLLLPKLMSGELSV